MLGSVQGHFSIQNVFGINDLNSSCCLTAVRNSAIPADESNGTVQDHLQDPVSFATNSGKSTHIHLPDAFMYPTAAQHEAAASVCVEKTPVSPLGSTVGISVMVKAILPGVGFGRTGALTELLHAIWAIPIARAASQMMSLLFFILLFLDRDGVGHLGRLSHIVVHQHPYGRR